MNKHFTGRRFEPPTEQAAQIAPATPTSNHQDPCVNSAATPQEQIRRAAIVDQVRHDIEAGGGNGGRLARADQDAWVRGDLTVDQLIARLQIAQTLENQHEMLPTRRPAEPPQAPTRPNYVKVDRERASSPN